MREWLCLDSFIYLYYFCFLFFTESLLFFFSGYVAVMNRSQKDIQDNVPIRTGTAKELSFFQSHPRYQHLLSKCGTPVLAATLNQV